ncbi:hypothetical protein tinsulaeT_19330 [Thalassotalea insulae]|uniref:histidine kinase n=1 Tax=Thalassotalea insulae TaxID=2056778 RepID=A0ABQ6GRM3_9GAMM|nr:HAMP domain-containing sensor histidine kinase [Thalassotalea insulae]GLX78593.1 hypothetical protein tinsulaeT_19330 [Thalassotalea insulae]
MSITHQAWLLSFTLVLVLIVLISPLFLHDDKSDQYPTHQISKKISTAFHTGGIEEVKAQYAGLASNVYVVIEDDKGNAITSNSAHSNGFSIRDINKTEPTNVSGKSSINYHYDIVPLDKSKTARIVVWSAQSNADNPMLTASLFIGSVVIAAILSFFWGYTIQRRLQKLNQLTSQIINSGDVSLRLPQSSSSKDFDELENNLNGMLNKIETLMEDARHTGDAIAHDLRVPLTRLKNRLETISPRESDVEQQLEQANSEIDHIIFIFNALLRLSILASGKQLINLAAIELSELVQEVVEFYQPLAEDKNISVKVVVNKAAVNADKQLLFQALSNVLDNAIKFAPQAGKVIVAINISDSVYIAVSDNGVGVPPEEMQKLSQRFYRGDKSRTQSGTGLGLSLVKAIVNLHQGQLEFADNGPGLVVTLRLPYLKH